MKYTSTILLEIFWPPKFVTLWKQLKNNLDLCVLSTLWVHQEFSDEVYFKYTLNLFLKCIYISFLTQKYTQSRLSKLTNLHSNLSVLEVYFLNWCIYVKTQKYTWDGLSKFM